MFKFLVLLIIMFACLISITEAGNRYYYANGNYYGYGRGYGRGFRRQNYYGNYYNGYGYYNYFG
uniref:Uncharacterized protein n=1 Tax=Pristionchus pacificus TaxID=54126 RepID=A0A454XR79_PRIPA|eukprot:PDM79354.1 hypothetical protein PRIPAC_31933 [Pristionchus pacificus]